MTKSRDLANAATALNAVTATELGYVDGVTSAIQTQLDAKIGNVVSANTSTDALRITQTGSGNALVVEDSANPDSSSFTVTSDGKVTIGSSSPAASPSPTSESLWINTNTASGSQLVVSKSFDGVNPANIDLLKSRGTATSPTVVNSTDNISQLIYRGFDGTNYSTSSVILSAVDGTVSTGVVPGRISFNITNSAGTLAECMRMNSAGNVGIGTASPTAKLDVNGPVKSDNVVGANLLANGAFDIWQRGVGPFTSNVIYTADRWFVYSSQNYSIAQETSVIPTGATNAIRMTATGSSSFVNLQQSLEQSEVEKLAGKTVTFSVWLRANATYNGGFAAQINWSTTGNAQTPTWSNLAQTLHTPSTSAYTRVSVTATVPTNAKGLTFMIAQQSVLASGSVYYAALAKAEIGTLATDFVRLGGSFQADLAMCQRYYQIAGDTIYEIMDGGYMTSGSVAYPSWIFSVPMRTTPTGTVVGSWAILNVGQPVLQASQQRGFCLRATSSTTGSYYFHSNTTYYLTFSAEL
jgi:hypothetical protein